MPRANEDEVDFARLLAFGSPPRGNDAVAVSPDFAGERRLEVKDNVDGMVTLRQ